MKLAEFEKYMDDNFFVHWTSFYVEPKETKELTRLTPAQLDADITQIDYIGLSVGNESLMINLTVWAEDITDPIKVTSKMLGSNLNKCFYIMREILEKIKTPYYGVNSNL
jgi:hypothetical protein